MGLVFSLITMTLLANRSEKGDINAISMYFVVFLVPVILMVVLNTVFIMWLNTFKNRIFKLFSSFLPLVVCLLLFQKNDLTIPVIDGNLVFVALTAAIAIGITNLLWVTMSIKKNTKEKG